MSLVSIGNRDGVSAVTAVLAVGAALIIVATCVYFVFGGEDEEESPMGDRLAEGSQWIYGATGEFYTGDAILDVDGTITLEVVGSSDTHYFLKMTYDLSMNGNARPMPPDYRTVSVKSGVPDGADSNGVSTIETFQGKKTASVWSLKEDPSTIRYYVADNMAYRFFLDPNNSDTYIRCDLIQLKLIWVEDEVSEPDVAERNFNAFSIEGDLLGVATMRAVTANDGDIGYVVDVYASDKHLTVRYLGNVGGMPDDAERSEVHDAASTGASGAYAASLKQIGSECVFYEENGSISSIEVYFGSLCAWVLLVPSD
ncbi:MAG: hypothetical protein LBS92_04145 [Candidatus Methanoplasma sp.]|nr:hypothetical protein [Candidatus Methanoplasma sp.]